MGLLKSIKKGVKKAQKNTVRFFDKAGAKNVTTQFNIKKLVTNPKDYFEKNYEAFKKDAIHGVGVYKDWVTGNWSNLGKQGVAETRAAFGMKKDAKQEQQAEATGQAVEDAQAGDYAALNKTVAEGDLGIASDLAKKSQPYVDDYGKYAELGAGLYSDYQTGGDEGAKRALDRVEKADIKYASDAAAKVNTGIDAYEQGKAGDYGGASKTIKEGDMGIFSDAAAYAEKGAAEYEKGKAQYEKGRAQYEKGKAAYDAGKATYTGAGGGFTGAPSGALNIPGGGVGKGRIPAADFLKQTPLRQSTDRAIGRITAGIGNPGAPPPPAAMRAAPAPGSAGLGSIINDLLRAFGFAA